MAGTAVVSISPTMNPGGDSELINAGTLTLQGDMLVGPTFNSTALYQMQAGSITQFSSGVGVAYKMGWSPQNNSAAYPTIQSTATSWSNPAIIQTIPGNAGNNGYISTSCCDSALNLAYTKLINLGSSSQNAITVGGHLILNHVLMTGSGGIQQIGAQFGYQFCLDYLDVRLATGSPVLTVNGPAQATVCNHINNSVIMGTGASTMNLQWTGLTVSNTIFGIASPSFPSTAGMTWKNVLIASVFGVTTAVQPATNSAFLWDGGGYWTSPGSFNLHVLTDGTAAGSGNAPNAVQNIFVDGANLGGNGDLWVAGVSTTSHYVTRVTMFNGAGNLEDGTGGPLNFGYLNHNTSENSDQGGSGSTVTLNEFEANANQLHQATNILADRNFNIACQGPNVPPYVQQTSFLYDYNWLSNRKDPDPIYNVSVRPWNSATAHQGSVCVFHTQPKDTITVSSVTDPSDLVVSSTVNVNVGNYVYHAVSARGAYVTAVPSAGHITIGNDEDGVPGIPLAVAGQSLGVNAGIWTTGIFGDAAKGQHEGYSDPRLINPNATVASWDAVNGGPGTLADAQAQVAAVNGWDLSGNAVAFNPAFTVANWMAYMRKSLTPTSLALKGFAHDTAWANSTAYVVGQSVIDTARHLQICVGAGTSGGSTPAWNDLGGNTIDSGVTWADQGIGTDVGAAPILVYNSPGISGGAVN